MLSDSNCISFWLPKLEAAGLPVPETTIIKAEGDKDPVSLLDGKTPEEFWRLTGAIDQAARGYGYPAFLRTGHGSAKHQWRRTCYLEPMTTSLVTLAERIRELVEWSHVVHPVGLPTHVWVVRKMLRTDPLFRVAAWDEFPVTREFRFFVFDGEIVHRQPYWPEKALADVMETGQPTPMEWREKLERASHLDGPDLRAVEDLARRASLAVPGFWSVDLLADHYGSWFITDMAMGEASFKWDPQTGEQIAPDSFAGT